MKCRGLTCCKAVRSFRRFQHLLLEQEDAITDNCDKLRINIPIMRRSTLTSFIKC